MMITTLHPFTATTIMVILAVCFIIFILYLAGDIRNENNKWKQFKRSHLRYKAQLAIKENNRRSTKL